MKEKQHGLSIDLEDLEVSVREPLGLPLPKGSYYLADHTERLLALLEEFNTKATFFIHGWSAEQHPGLIARIARAGHEIAAHGYSHRFLGAYSSPLEFQKDLDKCLNLIAKESSFAVKGYRAPGFSLKGSEEMVFPVLKNLGIIYDSSVLPVAQPIQHGYQYGPESPFQWENGLLEIPPSCWNFLGRRLPAFGSWSLRLLPYGNTTAAIRYLEKRDKSAFLYLHPWEVFGQPASREISNVRFPYQRIWMLGKGKWMERRLRRLLESFVFTTYSNCLRSSYPVQEPTFY